MVQVSLLLTRRWFYHAVSVFLQSVLLLVVAYTTFYYRVDNFQVIQGWIGSLWHKDNGLSISAGDKDQ